MRRRRARDRRLRRGTCARALSLVALAALAALVALVAPLATAAEGVAATYHAYLCRIPVGPAAGVPAPADGVTFDHPGTATIASDTCAAGGSLRAALDGGSTHPAGERASVTFSAPAGLTIAGLRIWRREAVGPVLPFREPATNLAHTGVASVQGVCALSSGCTGRGTDAAPLAAANEVAVGGLNGVTQVVWEAFCASSNGDACLGGGAGTLSAVYDVFAADMVLEDPEPPLVGPLAGPLLGGGTLTGARSLSFAAADLGSGVHTAALVVDGVPLAARVLDPSGGACADRGVAADGRPSYVNVQPCPRALASVLTLDTDALAPGPHALALAVSDAAGNRTVAAAGTIAVAGRDGAPNGTPATRDARLGARFASNGAHVRTLRFGTRAIVTGRLTTAAGAPIAGARIDVVARERRRGARSEPLATASTRADGRFTVTLPSGPARTIAVTYTAFARDAAPAATAALRALVRAQLTVSAARRGVALRVAGRLAHLRRAGVAVAIQVRRAGAWRTRATVSTRAGGRYRWTGRLRRSDLARASVVLRARVDSPHYPFDAGASRAVTVRLLR